MGCTSSTETVQDPYTGETTTKKKLGGAYPGARRPVKNPHVPNANEFHPIDGATSTATAHFVAVGGGNALKLMDQPNRPPESSPGEKPSYVSVTLPPGVYPGDVIHVKAPDGRLNQIIIPEGMGPGSTFTVEFAADTPPTPATAPQSNESGIPTSLAEPEIPVAVAEPEIAIPSTQSSYPSAPAYPSANPAVRT